MQSRTSSQATVPTSTQAAPSSAKGASGHGAPHSHTDDLMRFSVTMPESLLMEFDQLVAHRGLAKNRSEVVRDLVREALVEQRSTVPGKLVMGTLTIVYDHHANDLQGKLHQIQHNYCDSIISSMHVHVSEHTCLEVIVIKGPIEMVQMLSNMIIGTKGVKNGKLVLATVEG